MKVYERNITRFLNSRVGALIMVAVGMAATVLAYNIADTPHPPTSTGPFAPLPLFDVESRQLSLVLNLALMGGVMTLMALINRAFNLLRSTTLMFIGLYMIMQASTPLISTQFTGGMVLNLTVLVALTLMYTTYQHPNSTRRVFLAFFLLAAGGMTQYAFIPYLPVFLIGCAQMRCFTIRTLLAAAIGTATPLWLLWGFGVIDISHIQPPQFASDFSQLADVWPIPMMVAVGLTVLSGFIITASNLIKVYSYNARSRAFNGILATNTMATLLLCIADFGNITTYVPLLNCCIALQTTLLFRINIDRRGYMPVILLIAAYTGLYIWSLWT